MLRRLVCLILLGLIAGAVPAQNSSRILLQAVTATGPGAAAQMLGANQTYQMSLTGTLPLAAVVNIEVSDNPSLGWIVYRVFNVSSDEFPYLSPLIFNAETSMPYAYVRGNVTAISGTGAAVTLSVYP
jgi:hypothetical protein